MITINRDVKTAQLSPILESGGVFWFVFLLMLNDHLVLIFDLDFMSLCCRSFMHFLTGVCAIVGGVFTGKQSQHFNIILNGSIKQ